MSLPAQLNFGNGAKLKTPSVRAVSVQHAVTPSNGTSFADGSMISWDIPCGSRDTFLDPAFTTLNFDVTFTVGGTSANVQALGYDFWNSLNLYSSQGSTLIESIGQNYNELARALRMLCSSANNALTGDTLTLDQQFGYPNNANLHPTGTTVSYSIPLISILGTLTAGSLFLPIGCLSSSIRLDMGLATAVQALAGTAASSVAPVSFVISNATLNINLITISSIASAQLSELVGSNFSFNSTKWSCFRNSIAGGPTSQSLVLSARYDSLRSIICAQRLTASQETLTAYSFESCRNNLSSYSFRLGASPVNEKPVLADKPAAYNEVRKLFGDVTSLSHPTLLSSATYINNTGATAVAANASPGSYLFGASLEPFSSVQNLLSGSSSMSSNLYLDLVFSTAPASACLDAFFETDNLITINKDSGTMQVSF